MTFLNTALLAGFAAVAIPILIHILSRRRYPLIDFSTLRFLRKLQRQQMRKLRLRQWLLLLLRTLAILFIVLAFTRPTLKQDLGIGKLSSGRIGMAIVIDGSASMQARNADGTSFQRAKRSAQLLLSMMNPGDRTVVILARKEPALLLGGFSKDQEALADALSEARSWDGNADLKAAVNLAVGLFQEAQDFRSELYVISDFCSVDNLPPPPSNLSTYFIPIRSDSPENIGIKEANLLSEIIESGHPVDVEIILANYGLREKEDVYYSLYLNGSRIDENVATLSPGVEIRRLHQVIPKEAGLQEGLVQIEESDVLPVDNRRYFCFTVPELIQVLLIGEESDNREIRLALTSARKNNRLIQLEERGRQSWDVGQISKFDIIIFNDPPNLTTAQTFKLARFTENGGGLLILPGNKVDVAGMNRGFFHRINAPDWGEKIGRAGQGEQFLSWEEPNLDSELFRGVLRPSSDPSSPRFYQALTFPEFKGQAAIRFTNGSPFLIEQKFGSGRVFICASSPARDWSDWRLRGIFAPLLHRMILQLAGGSHGGCNKLIAGDDFEISPKATVGTSADLIFPDGQVEILSMKTFGQRTVFLRHAINPAGIFRLQNDQFENLIAVNSPYHESNLKPIEIVKAFPAWFDNGALECKWESLETTVQESRYGRELWKLAFILGICVLVLESFIGSSSGQNQEPDPKASDLPK